MTNLSLWDFGDARIGEAIMQGHQKTATSLVGLPLRADEPAALCSHRIALGKGEPLPAPI